MSGDVLLLHSQNRTTIGDEMFHIPVRDGKGWFHLSMTAGQTNDKTIKFCQKMMNNGAWPASYAAFFAKLAKKRAQLWNQAARTISSG